jgi:Helix-turn-helix domain
MSCVDLDDLLTNEQTATLLGIKPNTLEIWRCHAKGPVFIKLGAHPSSPIRYQRSRVMAWIEANTHASTSSYSAPRAA